MSRSVLRRVTTSLTPNAIVSTKYLKLFSSSLNHNPNNTNTPGGLADLSAPNGGYRRLEWGRERNMR